MKRISNSVIGSIATLCIVLAVSSPLSATAPPPAPVVFFTDITSGPSSGGQSNKGAFLSIYGKNFGATQGSSKVTVGCGAVDNYPFWSDTKITVQLGVAAKTGDVIVDVNGVGISNGVPFTVRTGNILFVSPSGSDTTGDGSFAKPYLNIKKAKTVMSAGDIVYLRGGSYQTIDAFGAILAANRAGGSAALPFAFSGYPNETATLGQDLASTPGSIAILGPSITGGPFSGYVLSNLTLRGFDSAINIKAPVSGTNTDWRVVGNDLQCQNGNTPGGSACFEATYVTANIKMYGNNVHDVASAVPNGSFLKLYHAVYFGGSGIDLGWNVISNVQACRGFQTHATGGPDQHDILVHDNIVHDTRCDCLNINTVNPNNGPVRIWNNVLYNCGKGPDPSGQVSNYTCVDDAADQDNIPDSNRGGNIEVFNNSMSNCGSGGTGNRAVFFVGNGTKPVNLHVVNNIFIQPVGQTYLIDGGLHASGDHNIWFGNGAPPVAFIADLSIDPQFLGTTDFHLSVGTSTAADTGATTVAIRDFDGLVRGQQGTAFDIGAFEFRNPKSTVPAPGNAQGSVQ
jgi:hypothetical protein